MLVFSFILLIAFEFLDFCFMMGSLGDKTLTLTSFALLIVAPIIWYLIVC